MMLHLEQLRRDGGTQPRDHISQDIVRSYAEDIAGGAVLPPPTAFYDGQAYWLADGFHRSYAHELLGRVEIEVEVRQGTRRDAILFAAGANAAHGYRRTNDDKRRAVRALLADPEWAGWSDREIARRCHVGADLVGRLRPPPAPSVADRQIEPPAARKVTRGGSTFEMRTGSINRERADTAADADIVGLDEAAAACGMQPFALGVIAKAGGVPGGGKVSGRWRFSLSAIRDWKAAGARRGSNQLRIFLGELRAGAPIENAAAVSEIGIGEARLHAEAEQAGEYAYIEALAPAWKVEGDTLTIDPARATELANLLEEEVGEVEPDAPAPPFDFEAAQAREAAMAAIAALTKAPDPAALAEMWAAFVGHGVPDDMIETARAWLNSFADLFPDAEARRCAAVAIMMEKL